MQKFHILPANLPKDLTSYDLLKAFALITMVVDHVGYYFFPEQDWLRVIGRSSAPVWFFLIGYARSRDMSPRMWLWGGALVAATIVTGDYVLPFNVIFTMLLIRKIIDPVMKRASKNYEILFGMAVNAAFLAIPTGFLVEYGTAGMLFAMFGWLMRNRENTSYSMKGVVEVFALIFCVGAYSCYQLFTFSFYPEQSYAAVGVIALVTILLYFFRPVVFSESSKIIPAPFLWILQLAGRRTLEIYVLHHIVFKVVSLLGGHTHYEWFDPAWYR